MEWPPHFPHGCPGEKASDLNGEVFRLIKRQKVTAGDMVSHAEKCKGGCTHCESRPPCESAALSCMTTLEEAVAKKKMNRRFEGIARAELRPEHGKIAQTGPDKGHYSVWLRASAIKDGSNLFVPVPVDQ